MGYFDFCEIVTTASPHGADTSPMWNVLLPALFGLFGATIGAVGGPWVTAHLGRRAHRDQKRWEKRFDVYPELVSHLFDTKNFAQNILTEIEESSLAGYEEKLRYLGEQHFKAYVSFQTLAGRTSVIQSNTFRELVNAILAELARIHSAYADDAVKAEYFQEIVRSLSPHYSVLRDMAVRELE